MRLHREGYSILKNAGFSLLVANLLGYWLLSRKFFYGFAAFTLTTYVFLVSFFRQPMRFPPSNKNVVISPADGTIVDIKTVLEKEFFGEERLMISIFLSVFNVHINWIPLVGQVIYQRYHPGQYLVAFHPKSSELNERNTLVIEHESGRQVLVRQIAGLLARRIHWYVKREQQVQAGQELGFIKFGSRVDIFLPVDSDLKVQLYQTVIGSETILAELKEQP